jgi:UDP-N-acetyl-2-amino-2-deoxyglucuronate dehydrogenase
MSSTRKNFAVLGVGGFVAARHLEAIRATGNRVVLAGDVSDSVGILDRYGLDIEFAISDRQLFESVELRNRRGSAEPIDYVSICTPNDLHCEHCASALLSGAHAICEKPLAITNKDLDALESVEQRTGRRIYTVLQLRAHERLIELKRQLSSQAAQPHEVVVTYVTGRGRWYHASWKGAEHRSGGIAMNIGIHLFDLLIWLFGRPIDVKLYLSEPKRMSGALILESARVRWYLSVEAADVQLAAPGNTNTTFRCMTVDGAEIDFTHGFADLHQHVYRQILGGEGLGIAAARSSVALTESLRISELSRFDADLHPLLLSGF